MWRTLGKLGLGYATRRNSNQTAKNLPILHSTTTATIIRPFTSSIEATDDTAVAPILTDKEKKKKRRREAAKRRLNGALIQHYINAAIYKYNERVALGLFNKAVKLYQSMRNEGVYAGETLYGPLLKFVTMRTMPQQFYSLCDDIQKEDPRSLRKKECAKHMALPKLPYYELLFWIKIESEVWKVCDGAAEQQEKMSMLLETIDTQKFCEKENMRIMFKLMGKLSMESHAKKFLLELKRNDKNNVRGPYISTLIYTYATSIPSTQIEDIVATFQTLQAESGVASLCARFEKLKLIKACCDSLKVDLALDLVDSLLKVNFDVTVDVWNWLLTACDKANDCRLAQRIYSMMMYRDVCPNQETFIVVMSLCGKMEDFDGAYWLIEKLQLSDDFFMDCVYKPVLHYFQKVELAYIFEKAIREESGQQLRRTATTEENRM